jgi:hypothetical protein
MVVVRKYLHVLVARAYSLCMNPDVETGAGIRPQRRSAWKRWRVVAAIVAVLVCVPLYAVGGLLFGWFVKGTADASVGAKSPVAAVQVVLNATTHWADEDVAEVLPCLCSAQSGELRGRIKTIRADLATVPGTELTPHDFTAAPSDHGETVSVMVAVTTAEQVDGETRSYRSEDHEWRFDTVDGGTGWKVCNWDAPRICGSYLEC